MKICLKCGIEKEKAQFHKRITSDDGLRSWCKVCEKKAQQKYKKSNPKKAAESQSRWREANPESWMWQVAKQRAKTQGIAFEITKADVIIPAFCPILGIPLSKGDGVTHANSPSLDKIVPELGYVPGNVQVISLRANAMKNDASFEEMIALGKWAQSQIKGINDA